MVKKYLRGDNTMFKKLLLVLIVMTAVLTAQPEPGRGPEGYREKFSDKLNLTEQQESQIAELRYELQLKMIDLNADLQKLELGLKDKVHTDNPDRNAIHKTIDKISAKKGEIQKFRLDHRLEIRSLLTEKQRATFDSMPMMMRPGKHHGKKDFDRKVMKHKRPGKRHQRR
jgi:Spy/CpxP family protein refolding chaperone